MCQQQAGQRLQPKDTVLSLRGNGNRRYLFINSGVEEFGPHLRQRLNLFLFLTRNAILKVGRSRNRSYLSISLNGHLFNDAAGFGSVRSPLRAKNESADPSVNPGGGGSFVLTSGISKLEDEFNLAQVSTSDRKTSPIIVRAEGETAQQLDSIFSTREDCFQSQGGRPDSNTSNS
ncbi:uncharacterized protein EI90DRAFT_3010716 [Cantharellus anzutake]|uniref:uncharacterized protein n=1 Tax=Cantharellus anzutake TaxID=1750568 RepID=UPI00190399C5|nr:uncharacterized protein EI90DRAFT_3010716 [Cantharellus anzutake]KAF8343843.1 hypothetical protein EI90DRAFT_3010716 [Cantharellus anzutake]